jgi:SAM-dependent methyltransferase
MSNQTQIRTQPKANCICCGSQGTYIYQGLEDRLFGAPGVWSLKRCDNHQCGLLWLDPTPINEDIYLAYNNYYTHAKNPVIKESMFSKLLAGYRAYKYQYLVDRTTLLQRVTGKALSFFSFFKEHMDYPFVYFKDLKKGNLLELGVGSGDTLKLFNNWGWQAEGLDFDPEAVKYAASQGLKVYEGDIFSQQFPDESFDAIFSSHVLEHVPDPIHLMQESSRILKPGGVFVAVTPNASSRLHKIFKSSWRELDPPRHLNIFTHQALQMSVIKAGFRKHEIVSSNYSATGVCFISYKISRYSVTKMHDYTFFKYIAYFIRLFLNLTHRLSHMSGEELVLVAYK